MRNSFLPSRRDMFAATVAAALLLTMSGCAQVRDLLRSDDRDVVQPVDSTTDEPLNYVREMSRLASGDPATQAKILADAAAAAKTTPDTSTRLRYALLLATPGHPGSDAPLAQTLLRELLADAEPLTPVETSLATVHLNQLEARLVLSAEARSLRLAHSRAANSENAAAAERLAAVESENRQLRQSLAEAEQKLEAITSIERSIRQQGNDNGQR